VLERFLVGTSARIATPVFVLVTVLVALACAPGLAPTAGQDENRSTAGARTGSATGFTGGALVANTASSSEIDGPNSAAFDSDVLSGERCLTGGTLVVNGPAGNVPDACSSSFRVPANPVLRTDERTMVAIRVPGYTFGTRDLDTEIPGLSLVKMLMADWVLENEHPGTKTQALLRRMIVYSDDSAADEVWETFGTKTISEQIDEYGLRDTELDSEGWGYTHTTLADLTTFVSTLRAEDPGSPVLDWMTAPAKRAADGTRQLWGTGTLPGISGTKYGWSNDDDAVSSLSFGPGFVVAAFTLGSGNDQTDDVHRAMSQVPYFRNEYLHEALAKVTTVASPETSRDPLD